MTRQPGWRGVGGAGTLSPAAGWGHLAGGVAAPRLAPPRAQRGCSSSVLQIPALPSRPAACGLPSFHRPNLCPTWVGLTTALGPPWGRPLSHPLPPRPLRGGVGWSSGTPLLPPRWGAGSSAPHCSGRGGGLLREIQGCGNSGARPARGPSLPLGLRMRCPVSDGRPHLGAGRAPRAGPPLASIPPPAPRPRCPRTPRSLDPSCRKDEATRWRPLLGDRLSLVPPPLTSSPETPSLAVSTPLPAPSLPRGSLSSRSICGLPHLTAPFPPVRVLRVLRALLHSSAGPWGCNPTPLTSSPPSEALVLGTAGCPRT